MKQKSFANKSGKKPTPEYDSAREQTVLLEQMNKTIQLIAEQHSTVIIKLDKIDARLDKIDARLDRIDARLDKIDIRLDKIESEIKTVWAAATDDSRRIKKLETVITDKYQQF